MALSPLMAILVVLGICALVLLVLLLPFRASSGGAPGASHPPEEPPSYPPALGAENPASATGPGPVSSPSADLLREKDRIFQALADLRFDFEAGKLSREDFLEEDERLRRRAADILQTLEKQP